MRKLGELGLSLGIALIVWFFSLYITIQIIPELLEKLKEYSLEADLKILNFRFENFLKFVILQNF